MSMEISSRGVRFTQAEEDDLLDTLKIPRVMDRPHIQTSDSGGSGSSGDSQDIDHLGVDPRLTPHTGSFSSVESRPQLNSMNSSMRGHRGSADSNGTFGRAETSFSPNPPPLNGTTNRPQRPIAPARTPSSTYAPARRPPQPPYMAMAERNRSGSTSRFRQDPNASYRAQEKAYVQRLRQDQPIEYFEPYTPSIGYGTGSDTEDESPAEAHFDNDPYDQETLMFYGNDNLQPTAEDLVDPANRERLEWHGMLASVLTGDVVRQEKKRLIGASDKQGENLFTEIWLELRAKVTGRSVAAQKRMSRYGA